MHARQEGTGNGIRDKGPFVSVGRMPTGPRRGRAMFRLHLWMRACVARMRARAGFPGPPALRAGPAAAHSRRRHRRRVHPRLLVTAEPRDVMCLCLLCFEHALRAQRTQRLGSGPRTHRLKSPLSIACQNASQHPEHFSPAPTPIPFSSAAAGPDHHLQATKTKHCSSRVRRWARPVRERRVATRRRAGSSPCGAGWRRRARTAARRKTRRSWSRFCSSPLRAMMAAAQRARRAAVPAPPRGAVCCVRVARGPSLHTASGFFLCLCTGVWDAN